jgi:hypothetical protein
MELIALAHVRAALILSGLQEALSADAAERAKGCGAHPFLKHKTHYAAAVFMANFSLGRTWTRADLPSRKPAIIKTSTAPSQQMNVDVDAAQNAPPLSDEDDDEIHEQGDGPEVKTAPGGGQYGELFTGGPSSWKDASSGAGHSHKKK